MPFLNGDELGYSICKFGFCVPKFIDVSKANLIVTQFCGLGDFLLLVFVGLIQSMLHSGTERRG